MAGREDDVDDLPGSDEEERSKVEAMRALVEGLDTRAKEVGNLTLRRFLRARDHDVQKASSFFLKHLRWRQAAVPNGSISKAEVKNELDQKKMFIQGYDKKGHPIGVILGCRHNPFKRDIDEFKRFVVYTIERLCARMRGKVEKFTIIVDLRGWGYSCCDIRAYLAALDILQVRSRKILNRPNNYPERLGKVFLVHVPYMFMKAWKIIYPFIDEKTKEKFIFVNDENMKAKLMEDVDESQLPEKYGGRLELVPSEESLS